MNSEIQKPTTISPEELEAATQAEIARSIQPLEAAIESRRVGIKPGTGQEILGQRILDITHIVETSPERVAVDIKKPSKPDKKTEHDKERAHVVATVIDPEMTFIAQDNQRRAQKGKTKEGWSTKRQRAELSAIQWGSIAEEIYDENPVEHTPKYAKSWRNLHQSPRKQRKFLPIDK